MALTTVDGGLLSSTNAQYTGFKNRIINGGMRVSQRGTVSVSAGSPAYTLDRWRINPTGASTSVTQGTVGFGNQTYALQLNGATSLTNVEVQQRIEQANCYDLASTNVTVSFWMYTNKSTGVSGAQLSLVAPSAADNWSSQISGSATTYTIPSFAQNTATFVSYTFTTNANVANGLGILINTNTATVSGEWIQITGVQLEKGSTATSFDYRPYGTELALCQRYCQYAGSGANGSFENATTIQIMEKCVVTMRGAPSGAIYSGVTAAFRSLGTDFTAASPALANYLAQSSNVGGTSFWTQVTGFTGGTTNATVTARNNQVSNGGNFILLTSEL
jgi:hypothetical protein